MTMGMVKHNTVEPSTRDKKKGYIVGIGASAGGLEAVQTLLAALPANTGFPFVLVQHLSPDYKSLLCEILSRNTSMPVLQAEEGMEIAPNNVYVIQPGKNLEIANGRIRLSIPKKHELNLPIDMLFRSLAAEAGSHAIGVVLSGTGSDGSNGLKAIKENDGLAFVQDNESAKFDGMPKSAMRTGIVDAQTTPELIAAEIVHISSRYQSSEALAKAVEAELDEELLKKVYIILKKVCNVNFAHYKKATIIRRLERRMMLTRTEKFADYVELLYQSPDEAKALSKEVLIGVTSFFRDPEFFETLREKAVKEIILSGKENEPIRVWVAGCSTGEEAYSIAIIFSEEMERLKLRRPIKIFATDLDAGAIETAGKGIYTESIVDAVSVSRLSKFFTLSNGSYTVKREIRRMIIFSTHNVFQDPPFGKLDLISCRNMMIYFQPMLQNDLFSIFRIALKDKGYLFLGKSEAVGMFTDAFPAVDGTAKIFIHSANVKLAAAKNVPFLQAAYMEDGSIDDFSRQMPRREVGIGEDMRTKTGIEPLLLEQFLPGCLVVNSKNDLVYTYGNIENYVHISMGEFSHNLYDVLNEALKIPASTILKEAREKKQKVQYRDICFQGERVTQAITLTATPASRPDEDGNCLYALVFLTGAQPGLSEDAVPYEVDKAASQRIADLEQYLQETQDKLEKSLSEQECVNEELQSTNEELLTANEELQSSNEELQSVNEELYTVNAEFQQKLTELSDSNDDVANFLSSTMVGIIFVDENLCIKRFTDYVSSEFEVMNHDIGRSIESINYQFRKVDFIRICTHVLETLIPDDREVSSNEDKIFLMRTAPYRSTERSILGCVITLVDVTVQKQDVVKLRRAENQIGEMRKANNRTSETVAELAAAVDTVLGCVSKAKQLRESDDNDSQLAQIAKAAKKMKELAASLLKNDVRQ